MDLGARNILLQTTVSDYVFGDGHHQRFRHALTLTPSKTYTAILEIMIHYR